MINPIYILLAKSSSQDKDTGSFSVFDIVETIQFTKIPKPTDPNEHIIITFEPMRVIAAWASETDEDRSREYDHEILAFLPGAPAPLVGGSNKFRFQPGMPNQRFTAIFGSPLPLVTPGILRFQSRIRVTGTQTWQTQSYVVTVKELAEAPENT